MISSCCRARLFLHLSTAQTFVRAFQPLSAGLNHWEENAIGSKHGLNWVLSTFQASFVSEKYMTEIGQTNCDIKLYEIGLWIGSWQAYVAVSRMLWLAISSTENTRNQKKITQLNLKPSMKCNTLCSQDLEKWCNLHRLGARTWRNEAPSKAFPNCHNQCTGKTSSSSVNWEPGQLF